MLPPPAAAKTFSSPRNPIRSNKIAPWPSKPSPRAPWPPSRGKSESLLSVNAGARLDRLPISSCHRRILTLISIGMFFDGYDVYVAASLPISALASAVLIPRFGWRIMFVIGGVGALIVWYLRKSMPESPRWLESVGRTEETEKMLLEIEREFANQDPPLPVPAAAPPSTSGRNFASLFGPQLFSRLFVGATVLIVANTLIYGFVTWLPSFFVQEGRSMASSFKYSFLMSIGAPVGAAIGALTADSIGRKPAIIGASVLTILFGGIYPFIRDPRLFPLAGFLLVVCIYILVALLFAIYVPELFPTDF